MDLNWIQKKVKQEEPVEYFLISTLSDGELNVDIDTYSNGEVLTESSLIQVKREHVEPVDVGYEDVENSDSVDPLACSSEKSETSEYEPDSDFEDNNDDDNDSDYDGDSKMQKKSPKPKRPTKVSTKLHISIIDDEDIISNDGPPYTCRVCSLTFPLEKSLIAHQSLHKGKKFRCDLCRKVFRTRSHIHEHMKIHLEPKYTCPICSKKFALRKSFFHHQATHEEKKFKCEVCLKPFRQKVHVKEHMKVHSARVKKYECEICDMAYYEQRTLNRHMKLAHSNAQRKRYRCPNTMCDKSYSSAWSFRQHACVDGRRPQDLAKMDCLQCDKRFFNKFELSRHVKRTHSVIRPDDYQCDLCERPFRYRYYDTFVQHVAQKCTKTVMYDCDYCVEVKSSASVKIASKTKLVEHFFAVHGIECASQARHCPFCDECFFTKNNLNHHLKKRHADYTCIHCCKTFRAKRGYTVHQKHCMLKKRFDKYAEQANIDGYPKNGTYACEKCKCFFITQTNLLEHMTEVHLEKNYQFNAEDDPVRSKKCRRKDTRRFQCTVCSRMFSRADNLRNHINTHSNIKQLFHCEICEKSYKTKSGMKKHFKRGDHRKSWQCEYCSIKLKRISGYTKHLSFCKKIKKKGKVTKV